MGCSMMLFLILTLFENVWNPSCFYVACVPEQGGDLESAVLEIINQHAGAEGIDYDSIMKHCAQRGFTDEDIIEDTIYGLRDDKCEIMEPRFGWFKPM